MLLRLSCLVLSFYQLPYLWQLPYLYDDSFILGTGKWEGEDAGHRSSVIASREEG